MTYNDATDSYCNDFLEPILNKKTGFLYDIPYRINREKYEAVVKKYNQHNSFKSTDVVVFATDYDTHDDGTIWLRSFYASPVNSTKESNDSYDCFLFQDEKVDEYFDFVKEILKCVIGPDKNNLVKLFEDKNKELYVLIQQVSTIKTILNCDTTCC